MSQEATQSLTDSSDRNLRSLSTLPDVFEDFRDLHKGQSIIVCGCGNSLNQLNEPERFISIGVNDVGRKFDPHYLVILNTPGQFAQGRYRYVEESKARAIFSHLTLGFHHPKIVRFTLGQRGGIELNNPQRLPYTRNSPYVAVCLAIHMGATRVGIIGVDFTLNHFYAETGRHKLSGELIRINTEYGRLVEASAKRGVEIVNLSSESALTSVPKCNIGEFSGLAKSGRSLNFVSYSTTPVAGVPRILSRCIEDRTPHHCRTVWATNSYGNGVRFESDVEWNRQSSQAMRLLDEADAIIVHNGRTNPIHDRCFKNKPVITMAHNYMWNVNTQFVSQGYPGVVVGQYQATLPEFSQWSVVPNPIPVWSEDFNSGKKDDIISIAYTPSGKHDRYPPSHRLYWHSKGYASTIKVLQRLEKKYTINLHVIGARQVSFTESMSMKNRSHIVIDECVTGSYHRNSLEGLATGCVVVNGLGLVSEIQEVFQRCHQQTNSNPFKFSSLEDLESILEQLIQEGKETLLTKGEENKLWMKQYWDFHWQWQQFWIPAIEQAFDRSGKPFKTKIPFTPDASLRKDVDISTSESKKTPTSIRSTLKPGVSIILPFGGEERIPLLHEVVSRLKTCTGVKSIILVEMGPVAHAKKIGELADHYIFARSDNAFNKSKVMNIGIPFVSTSHFMWLDSDLLLPQDFVVSALKECTDRALDCLIPWDTVFYLSQKDSEKVLAGSLKEADCKPVHLFRSRQGAQGAAVMVRTQFALDYGGMCEEFQGWGGEDNAWFYKVHLLGRINYTLNRRCFIYHLYHSNSSGYCRNGEHIFANPNYDKNFHLLKRIRAIRTRETLLNVFPPARFHTCPWQEKKRIYCSESNIEVGKIIQNLYGESFVTLCPNEENPDITITSESNQEPILTALQMISQLTGNTITLN